MTRNPEHYTGWNHRRRILLHQFRLRRDGDSPGKEDRIKEETKEVPQQSEIIEKFITEDLQFLVPLLIKFPKCYWMWNHRLWLLEQASTLLPASKARALWEGELVLVRKMLARDNRNFHGWGYRRIVVAALESQQLNPHQDKVKSSMVKEEFEYTTKMIITNMSNFSAWHNRSKLIPRLLEESSADDAGRRKMLDEGELVRLPIGTNYLLIQSEELLWITEALYTAPHDQSLWFYHQYLMCTFDPQTAPRTMAPNLTKEERFDYVNKEIDNVIELLEGAEDCKWIYQSLIQLSVMYEASCGRWPPQAERLASWMDELQRLDPMRKGRWIEVRQSLLL